MSGSLSACVLVGSLPQCLYFKFKLPVSRWGVCLCLDEVFACVLGLPV